MLLALMLSTDKEALICDFAETYHIYDIDNMNARNVAVLAAGLAESSRIMKKIRGDKIDSQTALLASIADRIGMVAWLNSSDGHKGINRPKSILEAIAGKCEEGDIETFDSGEEFKREWERLIAGG